MRRLMVSLWLGVVALGLALGPVAAAQCAPGSVGLRGDWGNAVFKVEIANTDALRAKGLMYRKTLPRFGGMLFVYPRPQQAMFWMKNTLIPLDMLFIDKTGVVKTIRENAVPGDLTVIDGGRGILAVLEVNGGTVATLGISLGTQIHNPIFGAGAVWPCD